MAKHSHDRYDRQENQLYSFPVHPIEVGPPYLMINKFQEEQSQDRPGMMTKSIRQYQNNDNDSQSRVSIKNIADRLMNSPPLRANENSGINEYKPPEPIMYPIEDFNKPGSFAGNQGYFSSNFMPHNTNSHNLPYLGDNFTI